MLQRYVVVRVVHELTFVVGCHARERSKIDFELEGYTTRPFSSDKTYIIQYNLCSRQIDPIS